MQIDANNFHVLIKKNSAIPIEQLIVIEQKESLRVTEIKLGIIFIFAAWSGPAIKAFQAFTKVISEQPKNLCSYLVLDIDCLNNDRPAQLLGIPSFQPTGSGEILWVKDGAVQNITQGAPISEDTFRNQIIDFFRDGCS